MLYVTERVTIIDKLNFLWCLCCIAHYKEQQQPVAYSIHEEFGKDIYKMYMTYLEYAMIYGYVNKDGHTLTEKGQRAVARWREVSDRLFGDIT
jgi:hypothetical protein